MKTQIIVLNILLCLATAGLFSCNGVKEKDTNAAKVEVLADDIVEMRNDQVQLAGIETGSAELRSLSGTLKVNGIITTPPQSYATVCMPLGGFVKSTALMPGNAVIKGQVLAVIENQEFIDIQQNYLEVKNRLGFAEADFKRHSELYKEDVYSEKNLQQVSTEYRNLKAQLRALEEKLRLIGINPSGLSEENIRSSVTLCAPISGFLKAVNVNLGKYVAPSDVLFEIVNSDRLFLELTLFEKDAGKVAGGQRATFYINNEAEPHSAVINQTGRAIGADKTMRIYANVTDTCKSVLPGMYVNAVIETSDQKVLSLPSDAVVSFDDKDYIFVFERNKEEDGKPFTEYRMVQVRRGATDNGFTEIILPEGVDITTKQVVLKGAYNLLSAKKNAGEMAC